MASGFVLWLTGLSAAGKSTIAGLVAADLEERGLPYNELHDRGYASIGCTHCTKPGAGRDGRWAGNAKTECGLHVVTE